MSTLVSWAGEIPAPTAQHVRGAWWLEQPSEKPIERDGVITTVLHMGARNSEATDTLARIAAYPVADDIEEQLLGASEARSKVFVLRHGESMFGVPRAEIRQGTVFPGTRGVGLLGVGKRTQGLLLNGVIDMIVGTNKTAVETLNERWYLGTGIPPTKSVNLEELKKASEKAPRAIIWTHPGFGDGSVPGCVWYVNEVHDNILEGYLWCPPSTLTSEHGSVELKDILDGAMCVVEPAVRFGDCFSLPEEPRAAYKVLFGS
jgi:hypothetical protein